MDTPELKQNENQPDRKKVPCFFRKQVSEMLNDNKDKKEKLLSQLGPEAPRWAEEYKLSEQHLESLLNTQEKLYDIVSPLPVFQGFPKTELWRLFMDGKDHEKGILGFENERGYMEGMMRGFIQVVKTLSEKLDHSSYENLHNICISNVSDEGVELLSSYSSRSKNFKINYHNWSEEGYQELQKKYDEGHVVGRHLGGNPEKMLGPERVKEKMLIFNNIKQAIDIKNEILQIRKNNLFDKRINELKAKIQEIAKASGVVDTVKNSFDININKIRLKGEEKEVRYVTKDTTVGELREGVQIILDEYYIKVEIIDKSKDELESMRENEERRKKLHEKDWNEIIKNIDSVARLAKCQESKEIIDRCDRNINHIKKRINLLNSGTVKTLSVADQKLAAVVECCQNLDQLHAFADGNVRTATLVLNKFLIELGEYPCIFDNPNVLDVKSIRELMEHVRKGQEKFASYKNVK